LCRRPATTAHAESRVTLTYIPGSLAMKLPHRRQFLHLAAGAAAFPAVARVARAHSLICRATSQTGVVTAALIFWSLLMLWLCWRSGIRPRSNHDYAAYVGEWQLLLTGADPWSTDNSYGPLHTAIGFLLPWGPLAPKFFMVGALLVANTALVLELMRERGMSPIQVIYLLAIPTNVLVVGVGVMYGLNDAFVAALLVVAVLLRHRCYLFTAGVVVGLAALTKFYPLLLLPFFALDGRRLSWSVIASGIAVFCVGLTVAFAIWGQGPINAILFGSNRDPKLLSIIAALKSLLGNERIVTGLIKYNTYFVISGVAAAFLFAWTARLNWLEGSVLGYLVMLTLYKVGHAQFYVPWLFMVASLPLINEQSADRMAIILLPASLLLSLYQFGYAFGSDDEISVLGPAAWPCRRWVGLCGGFIAFPVSAASIAACVVDLWMNRYTSSAIRTPVS
jgi:hypothetical protein